MYGNPVIMTKKNKMWSQNLGMKNTNLVILSNYPTIPQILNS